MVMLHQNIFKRNLFQRFYFYDKFLSQRINNFRTKSVSVSDEEGIRQNISEAWYRLHRDCSHWLVSSKLRVKNKELYLSEHCIRSLSSILDLPQSQLERVSRADVFKNSSEDAILNTAEFLRSNDVLGSHVLTAPWLLAQDKETLKAKCSEFVGFPLFESVGDGVGFSLFPIELIARYRSLFVIEKHEFEGYPNKIYFLAQRLKLPVPLLTLKVAHAWHVLHTRRNKLEEVIKILIEFRIRPSDIVNDIWIFLHNTELMRTRLERISEVSEGTPKLWVCRCNEFYFQRTYLRKKSNSRYENMFQLLMEELDCHDEELCKTVYEKAGMEFSSMAKIINSINTLVAGGMTKEYIRRHPMILRYAPERSVERFNELVNRNIEPRIYWITVSEPKFQEYLIRATQNELQV